MIHIRPSARYKNPDDASILATTSDTFPTRIFDPNPPFGVGHKNAITAAPNVVNDNPITNTIERLKN